MIQKLTSEQEALIPVYREKWREIAVSTEPIDRQKAAEAVKYAYSALCLEEPEIIFCESPYAAVIVVIVRQRLKQFNQDSQIGEVGSDFTTRLIRQPHDQLRRQLHHKVIKQLYNDLKIGFDDSPLMFDDSQLTWSLEVKIAQLCEEIDISLDDDIWSPYYNFVNPRAEIYYASLFNFCDSVLNCTYNLAKGKAIQSLVKYCGWIYPTKSFAIICDRPRKISVDNQQRLHAEAEPAIEFADGFSVYAYHGVVLPEEYGLVPPYQWRSQWLLEEDNAELRRVLIQEIGYERICQELQAIELDNWQEYALLKINAWIDVESVYLLKMTCPSTGHIHVLRVPPNIQSAREAISWVNWGVDPEDFSVQT